MDGTSKACLSSTSRGFNRLLGDARSNLGQCKSWLFTCRLEKDRMSHGRSAPRRLACCLCKSTHPTHDFRRKFRWDSADLRQKKFDLDPVYRLCSRYRARNWRSSPFFLEYRRYFLQNLNQPAGRNGNKENPTLHSKLRITFPGAKHILVSVVTIKFGHIQTM